MDKVKSFLGGGSKNQNDPTYDEDSYSQTATHNSGRLTGEGTHLGAATGNADPELTCEAGTTSSGGAPTTTGPHSSDIMYKADPHVDSDTTQGNTTSSDFANKAASTAWSAPSQSGPGQEDASNPYATSSVDPRVDNVPRTQDTTVGATPASSTADPTGPGIGSTPSDTTGSSNKQGMMDRAPSAVGLGSTAAKAEEHTPTATAGTDSYDTSTQIGGPPSHRRKESIPTTAYPSGTLDSVRAVAPPVGAPASGNSTAIVDEPGAGDNTGRANVGQTSTYGSHYLGSGEPTSSVVDPSSSDPTTYRKPETSHLGRDVGIGAGVGAAGVGAAVAYDRCQDQPGAQTGLQSDAPTSTAGGEHAPFYDAATGGQQPATSSVVESTRTSHAYETTPDRHTGSDAAEVGAGTAAVGAGAYEYEKHQGAKDLATGTSTGMSPITASTAATSQPYDQTADRHLGRDTAAAGVGAHEHSKHEERKLEKEKKAHDKALAKEERKHEKAIEKEERHREKELAKEEKAHDHHAHHKEEDAAAVSTAGAGAVGAHEYDEHEKERKPSLMQRILHPRSSRTDTSGQDEASGLAAADAADRRAFHEHGDASTTSKPNITPAGYAEAPTKGYASQVTSGTGMTALAQGEGGPSGSHATALGNVFESKDPSARTGSAPNYPTAEGQATGGTTYAEPPSTGHASEVTGGTGTTALASGSAGEPLGQGGLTGTEHQHGIQGSGLTRESMTGQPGTGHQFGEITDHKR